MGKSTEFNVGDYVRVAPSPCYLVGKSLRPILNQTFKDGCNGYVLGLADTDDNVTVIHENGLSTFDDEVTEYVHASYLELIEDEKPVDPPPLRDRNGNEILVGCNVNSVRHGGPWKVRSVTMCKDVPMLNLESPDKLCGISAVPCDTVSVWVENHATNDGPRRLAQAKWRLSRAPVGCDCDECADARTTLRELDAPPQKEQSFCPLMSVGDTVGVHDFNRDDHGATVRIIKKNMKINGELEYLVSASSPGQGGCPGGWVSGRSLQKVVLIPCANTNECTNCERSKCTMGYGSAQEVPTQFPGCPFSKRPVTAPCDNSFQCGTCQRDGGDPTAVLDRNGRKIVVGCEVEYSTAVGDLWTVRKIVPGIEGPCLELKAVGCSNVIPAVFHGDVAVKFYQANPDPVEPVLKPAQVDKYASNSVRAMTSPALADAMKQAYPRRHVKTYCGTDADGAGIERVGDAWLGGLATQAEFFEPERTFTIDKTMREQEDHARWRCDDYDLNREPIRGTCRRCGLTTCMHPRAEHWRANRGPR